MNLILLFQDDFTTQDRVSLYGRRVEHILKVHHSSKGDTLTVGLLNGKIGKGTIIDMNSDRIDMEIFLESYPPPPTPLTLVLALPRPKMLRRILQSVASLGIKKIYLINSWRVEKGFWSSPLLEPNRIKEELVFGLEQAKDTIIPEVYLRRFFKPFVEEELARLITGDAIENYTNTKLASKNQIDREREGKVGEVGVGEQEKEYRDKPLAITAHPKAIIPCPENVNKSTILVMGPEGGFIDIEIETLEQAGFTTVNLGKRILRLETAVPFIVAKLF